MSSTNMSGAPLRPPRGGVRTMLGGMAVFGSLYMGFYFFLLNGEKKKRSLDAADPGVIPTWQHRIGGNASLRTVDSIPRAYERVAVAPVPAIRPEVQNGKHRTITEFLKSDNVSFESRAQHPTPQRPHHSEDGKLYTKKVVKADREHGTATASA